MDMIGTASKTTSSLANITRVDVISMPGVGEISALFDLAQVSAGCGDRTGDAFREPFQNYRNGP
jgi:imidazoleglycerol phosphate synthase glutamine amidotransferase subunit HisH